MRKTILSLMLVFILAFFTYSEKLTSENVIAYQINDKEIISAEEAAINLMLCVLKDRAYFFEYDYNHHREIKMADSGEYMLMSEFLSSWDYSGGDPLTTINCKINNFMVVNMDDDNIPEVILELSVIDERLVLHYYEGKIYGHEFVIRGMSEIMSDGKYTASGGAMYSYFIEPQFIKGNLMEKTLAYSDVDYTTNEQIFFVDDKQVSGEVFDAFIDDFYSHGSVEWHEYSEESFEADLRKEWEKVVEKDKK